MSPAIQEKITSIAVNLAGFARSIAPGVGRDARHRMRERAPGEFPRGIVPRDNDSGPFSKN